MGDVWGPGVERFPSIGTIIRVIGVRILVFLADAPCGAFRLLAGQVPSVGSWVGGFQPAQHHSFGSRCRVACLDAIRNVKQTLRGSIPPSRIPPSRIPPGWIPASRIPPGWIPPGRIPPAWIPTGQCIPCIPTGHWITTGQNPGNGALKQFIYFRRVVGFWGAVPRGSPAVLSGVCWPGAERLPSIGTIISVFGVASLKQKKTLRSSPLQQSSALSTHDTCQQS